MHGLLKYRRWLIVGAESLLITATYYFAFQIDFDFATTPPVLRTFLKTLPFVLLIKLLVLRYFGLLGGWWRYTGLSEMFDVARASAGSSILLFIALGLLWRPPELHLTMLVIDLCLTLTVIGGARLTVRAYTEHAAKSYSAQKNVLLVGAGRLGTHVARELSDHAELDYAPVAFVDDDPSKLGIKIHGIPVRGTTDDVPRLIDTHAVACVVIALRHPPGILVRRVIEQCRQRKVEFKIAPAIEERVNGSTFSILRSVCPDDLLGRTPVNMSVDPIRARFQNRAVLITGAGGSIGSELVRQVASFNPRRVVLLDRSENDLFKLGSELSHSYPHLHYVSCVGDILDVRTLRDIFALYRPDSVFHAAAYKHVPMMELNCWQAITNNVFGTYNVASVAREHRVDDFIMISTDKAVNPTNIMGVTKRIAELIILALQQEQHTRFTAVRFGNVLGSNGSVLPLFQKQIAAGGPITVTHPDVTRYFMTIPEAVQLVLQASAMGHAGEIFVLDMGEPVRILDLAQTAIRLAATDSNRDIPIVFTGLRPGEKLYEELNLTDEGLKATTHERIRVLDGGKTDLVQVQGWLDSLSDLVESRNLYGLILKLTSIVPQYKPSSEILAAAQVDRYDYSRKYLRDRTALSPVAFPSAVA